jgi:hypothetical protein
MLESPSIRRHVAHVILQFDSGAAIFRPFSSRVPRAVVDARLCSSGA